MTNNIFGPEKPGFETVSFDEFADRLTEDLSPKIDIPVEVLKMKFSTGDTLSEKYLNRQAEIIEHQRKISEPIAKYLYAQMVKAWADEMEDEDV